MAAIFPLFYIYIGIIETKFRRSYIIKYFFLYHYIMSLRIAGSTWINWTSKKSLVVLIMNWKKSALENSLAFLMISLFALLSPENVLALVFFIDVSVWMYPFFLSWYRLPLTFQNWHLTFSKKNILCRKSLLPSDHNYYYFFTMSALTSNKVIKGNSYSWKLSTAKLYLLFALSPTELWCLFDTYTQQAHFSRKLLAFFLWKHFCCREMKRGFFGVGFSGNSFY